MRALIIIITVCLFFYGISKIYDRVMYFVTQNTPAQKYREQQKNDMEY